MVVINLEEVIVHEESIALALNATPLETDFLRSVSLPLKSLSIPVYGGEEINGSSVLDLLEAKIFLALVRWEVSVSVARSAAESAVLQFCEQELAGACEAKPENNEELTPKRLESAVLTCLSFPGVSEDIPAEILSDVTSEIFNGVFGAGVYKKPHIGSSWSEF